MLWRVVASVLALVFAAGPGLCCCTAASAAGLTAPAGRKTPPPSCCRHDHAGPKTAAKSARVGDTGGPRNDHHPGKTPCPCRGKGEKAVDQTAPAAAAPDDAHFYPPVLAFAVGVTNPAAGLGLTPAPGGGRSPPGRWLTAERLLDLHHRLRC